MWTSNQHSFDQPSDDTILWRFMSTEKFLSLFATQKLHLARLDTLGDPWELSLTQLQIQEHLKLCPTLDPEEETKRLQRVTAENFARKIWASCWHANSIESAAMWDLYASRNAGLAIVTTAKALRSSIITPLELYFFSVKYIDYQSWKPATASEWLKYPPTSLHTSVAFKRKSFAHEQEVRIVHMDLISSDSNDRKSVSIDIDLRKALHQIYVAPSAPSWHATVIQEVVKPLDLSDLVKQSTLYDPRVF